MHGHGKLLLSISSVVWIKIEKHKAYHSQASWSNPDKIQQKPLTKRILLYNCGNEYSLVIGVFDIGLIVMFFFDTGLIVMFCEIMFA